MSAGESDRAVSARDRAVSARELGKSYRIFSRPEDRLKQALWRGRRRFYREFWALRGLSFDVAWGQTVGIVGVNGSGKSTLLEIIAGTLTPSCGTCCVGGPVAALLDLGSSFNPDFTGHENVLLSAAVAGLSRQVVERRYDSIVAFADIGPFIDQPVKTYSAGMLVRLAFAVAIHVDPSILVIDEVLAVGDAAFQRKCFARIERIQASGAAVLLASHDAGALLGLCTSALLLDRGEILLYDDPKSVLEAYHRLTFAPAADRETLRESIRSGETWGASGASSAQQASDRFDPGLVSASVQSYDGRGAEIKEPQVTTADGEPVNVLQRGDHYDYRYTVRFDRTCEAVRFGMLIKTTSGIQLGGATTASRTQPLPRVAAGSRVTVRFRFRCLLHPGVYFLNAGALARIDGEETYVHRLIDAVAFRVADEAEHRVTGYVDFEIEPEVEVEL